MSKAVVETLARDANNNVYFTYASSAYVAEQIVAAHANVTAVRGDFTDSGQLEDLSRQMLGWDVLVNNAWAGKPEGIHFHKLTQEALLRSFTNNVLPTVSVTQKALGDILREEVGQDHHRAHIVCGGRAPVGLQSLCFNQGVSGTNGEVVGKGVW